MSNPQNTKAFDKIYCTRLLLKYWHELHKHCLDAKLSYAEVDAIEMQILMKNMFADPEVYVQSLIRGKQRTQTLLSHIQHVIEQWEKSSGATAGGRIRRRIIRQLYFEQPRKTVAAISATENKPRDVIGAYLQSALRQLSALLFGADGLLKTKEAMYLHTFEATPQCLGGLTAATVEDNHAHTSCH